MERYVENFSPIRLRQMRRKKSLSQRKLAEIAGITSATITLWEMGKVRPSVKKWEQVLAAIYAYNASVKPSSKLAYHISFDRYEDLIAVPDLVREIVPLRGVFSFETGKCYYIREPVCGCCKHFCDGIVFRYKCQEGIHHMFVAVNGGWSRTYTDAQLIGKVIEEVGA